MKGSSTSASAITTPSGVNRSCTGRRDEARPHEEHVHDAGGGEQDHPAVGADDHARHERDQQRRHAERPPAPRARPRQPVGDGIAEHNGDRGDGEGEGQRLPEDAGDRGGRTGSGGTGPAPTPGPSRLRPPSGRSCSGRGCRAGRRRRRSGSRGSGRAEAAAARPWRFTAARPGRRRLKGAARGEPGDAGGRALRHRPLVGVQRSDLAVDPELAARLGHHPILPEGAEVRHPPHDDVGHRGACGGRLAGRREERWPPGGGRWCRAARARPRRAGAGCVGP